MTSMHACSVNSLRLAQCSQHVDPALNHAPGIHHCWVDRDNVDSKLAQASLHKTVAAGIKLMSHALTAQPHAPQLCTMVVYGARNKVLCVTPA